MQPMNHIFKLEKILGKLEHLNLSFDYLKISLASPERIKQWAERILPTGEVVGEILRPETINFRTHQPEVYGLFCEIIFGPIKSWKCKCGQYNGFVMDRICEECFVEICESRVRRYRMGYIDLTCPVTHIWYFKGNPSYLTTLLTLFKRDLLEKEEETGEPNEKEILLKIKDFEQIIYFKDFWFSMKTEEYKKEELRQLIRGRNISSFENKKGAEILKTALDLLDVKKEIEIERNYIFKTNQKIGIEKEKRTGFEEKEEKIHLRRIRILESFLATKTNPSWMILTKLPILPPSLRPLVELENGRLVAADVNEIYRLIITRNQRLLDFFSQSLPDIVTIQGRKLLQESVDSLIDNARLPKEKQITLNNKGLKSLTEILEGKQGRFRQSLLGKRVDYSGRSVIVVGPNLRLNQCGLPYQMAVELFQPFLINELLKTKTKLPNHNTRIANLIIKKNKPFIWTLLDELTKKYSILLNRAPTLHRFGIQAFDPVLVLGQAIHLHPLVCTGFNADFDGDQMAVHLPLYETSQLEIKTMMRPSYNVLSPSNGEVILKPTQDMVIGCYYLTLMIQKNKSSIQKWFPTEKNALMAFYQKKIELHTPIFVRYKLYNLSFNFDSKKIYIKDFKENILLKEKEILIYKKFNVTKQFETYGLEKGNENLNKFYLLTNLGIFIGYTICSEKFYLTDLFLETTPGRLIFSINFKNAIKK